MEANLEINMEEGKINLNQNISLRPSWYGKINWADWRSVSPKLAEEYDKRISQRKGNMLEDWGEYISPAYDERLEYIKTILDSNNYSNNYINNYKSNKSNNTLDIDNKRQDLLQKQSNGNNDEQDFVIYSKKIKTKSNTNTKENYSFNDGQHNTIVDDNAYEIENQSNYYDEYNDYNNKYPLIDQ